MTYDPNNLWVAFTYTGYFNRVPLFISFGSDGAVDYALANNCFVSTYKR